MSLPEFLHPFARPASTEWISIVRGEGARVFDAEGRSYVDALASLWYCQVGHGRREIAERVGAQASTLAAYHCFDLFTNEPADELCARLATSAPMPEARVFLTSSGSEAVDSALKLARLAMVRRGEPERHLVVAREHAYHGVTYGGMSVQGIEANKAGFGPLLEGIVHAPHDDLESMARLFAERGAEIAAVIAEPVIGAGGVHPPAPGYLPGLRSLCDAHGALLILDEVVTGFGRLGHRWGATRYGVEPDLVTFAKGASSGYLPLGGVLVGPAVRAPLEEDPDFVLRTGHTYSGHPTCCAAGIANLDVLETEDLWSRADQIGARLGGGLRSLVGDRVVEVRGEAGIWAVGLAAGISADRVRRGMLERGVIARPLGTSTIAFCPPLVIEDTDVDRCVEALAASLEA